MAGLKRSRRDDFIVRPVCPMDFLGHDLHRSSCTEYFFDTRASKCSSIANKTLTSASREFALHPESMREESLGLKNVQCAYVLKFTTDAIARCNKVI